ncbi:MAG: acetyl-CoA carboxylase, carboxyltransferase subunit beta [Verrucomicrobia bacterium]|nr:acetyl-CoA carboxylase, carboxyltransferase subunit beta [Verrucomicrobiota bacterium]
MGIFDKPRLRPQDKRDDMPEGMWTKCPSCDAMLHQLDLKQNLNVCPPCGHHFLMGSRERVENLADPGSFEETNADMVSANPLGFANYSEKIEQQRKSSGLNDAVITGRLRIEGMPAMIAVMDFRFFAGSMGSVVGEKITRAIEQATAEKRGVIIISASSGARMQEGMLSLMQMAKTCGALALHAEAKLPYISVMTHPTTGGVTASFATIGDVNLAEPKCMIGFAGPRVVKETTHQNLPPGFQTAEFMMEHGLVDDIVARKDLRGKLGKLLAYMLPLPHDLS